MENFRTWDEIEKEIFTPEEIAESNLRVAQMSEQIMSRNEQNVNQQKDQKNCFK